MSATKTLVTRRAALTAAAAAALAWALPFRQRVARAQKATLLARQVSQVPGEPEDAQWQKAEPLEVPLGPQVVVKPRTYEAGIERLQVRALYDNERLALLIEWGDPTREMGLGGVDSFRDAVAVQFPADPSASLPFFGMGEQNKSVTIYQWKADWQFGSLYDVNDEFPHMAVDLYPFSGKEAGEIPETTDYAGKGDKAFVPSWWTGNLLADADLQSRTPVEKLLAEGFGTIHADESQDAQGKGIYKDGRWQVLISVPRKQEGFSFQQGQTMPVAFAAWDGSRRERGGEKAVSTWYFLSLEQSVSPLAYINPIVVVAGVALLQWFGLRRLRRRSAAK